MDTGSEVATSSCRWLSVTTGWRQVAMSIDAYRWPKDAATGGYRWQQVLIRWPKIRGYRLATAWVSIDAYRWLYKAA